MSSISHCSYSTSPSLFLRHSEYVPKVAVIFSALLLKIWSEGQQRGQHLRVCRNPRVSGPVPALLNQHLYFNDKARWLDTHWSLTNTFSIWIATIWVFCLTVGYLDAFSYFLRDKTPFYVKTVIGISLGDLFYF